MGKGRLMGFLGRYGRGGGEWTARLNELPIFKHSGVYDVQNPYDWLEVEFNSGQEGEGMNVDITDIDAAGLGHLFALSTITTVARIQADYSFQINDTEGEMIRYGEVEKESRTERKN